MDSLRNFSQDQGGDGAGNSMPFDLDESGIEAPPAIGNDERRMHVRAYNFWAQMLNERSYPSIEDLDLENLEDFGGHTVLLDFTTGIENPGIGYIGDALRKACDLEDDIAYISQVPSRSLLSRLTDHYLQIIANQAPIGFEAEFDNHEGITIMYRGILLPFSSDDDNIDFILGVINWKEMVKPDQDAALTAELARSIAQNRAGHEGAAGHAKAPLWTHDDDASDDALPDEMLTLARLHHDSLARPAVSDQLLGRDVDEDDDISSSNGALQLQDGDMLYDEEEPADDASLADWLALARDCAVEARDADVRGRSALYRAVGRAYDFALMADSHPTDYAEMLSDAGIAAQARAPMTPLVKLVFGVDYDKTRLTEYATVIGFAREQAVERGDLPRYLERYEGGLKAVVKAARAKKRGAVPETVQSDDAALHEMLRNAMPMGFVELNAGDSEFVLLVGRKMSDEQVGVVGALNDPQLLEKVIRKLLG